MRDRMEVTGMVLKASPQGEYDKRLVILTAEIGKITAFVRGARRPGNQLMAASCPFVFGKFYLYEGRNSYTMAGAEVENYFDEISLDVEKACYGSYFLEFADYYGRENLEATDTLKLLYQSLRALNNERIPNPLVRSVFDLKLMEQNGEYQDVPGTDCSEACAYAWNFVLVTPVEHLYTFALKEEVFREFQNAVEKNKKRFVDKAFHSLDILRLLVDNVT